MCVDSHWEDISFRLDNLNILTRFCERLVSQYTTNQYIPLCRVINSWIAFALVGDTVALWLVCLEAGSDIPGLSLARVTLLYSVGEDPFLLQFLSLLKI